MKAGWTNQRLVAALFALLVTTSTAGAQQPAAPALPPPPTAQKPAQTATTPAMDQAAAERLAAKVQAYYEKSRDLVADISQRYRYRAAGRTLKASGTLEVRKPGLLRWSVSTPSQRVFIIDGKTLQLYDAEEKTLTIRGDVARETMPAAVSFLWGQGQLLRDFAIKPAQRPQDGATVIELVPRQKQAGFQRLYFAVDPATGQVQVSVVIDVEGNENRIQFANVRTNTGVGDARFKFEPPAGTRVVRP